MMLVPQTPTSPIGDGSHDFRSASLKLHQIRINRPDPVRRFVVRFARVESRQEILQVTYFFDVVLDPRLALSLGKQERKQQPSEGPESRSPGDNQAILVTRAAHGFREHVLHSRNPDAALDHIMNEPTVIEFLDRRNRLDLVRWVATQVLAQGDLRSSANRAIWRGADVARIHVVQRMPYAVAREPPSLDLDLALQVSEPPGEHSRGDVFEDVVLDPDLLSTVFEGLDPGAGRRNRLELPEKWERFWKMCAHLICFLA